MQRVKYLQVKEWLQEIALKPESKVRMPTVAETRRQFGVSLAPVTRALRELENEGVIICRQGSGIVATGQSREVNGAGNGHASEGSLVLAYPDYLSERIWDAVHTVEQHTHSKRLSAVNYKFNQQTPWEEVFRFAEEQDDCRGLVILTCSGRVDQASLDKAATMSIPVVLVDNMHNYANLPGNVFTLAPDPASSGRLMAEALLSRGHERIGYVRNEPQCDYNIEKLKAIKSTIQEAGHSFTARHVLATTIKAWDNALEAACRIVEDNLETIRELELTSLIFTSSPGAFAAASVLAEHGIAVPETISLIGEGDYESSRYMYPPLSVVTCDYTKMHCMAVEIACGDNRRTPTNTLLACHLINRRSIHESPLR